MFIEKRIIQGPDRYKSESKIIVIHETANARSTIDNEVSNSNNNWATQYAYVNYFVDDKRVVQTFENGYQVWGAGPTANSKAYSQIEMVRVSKDKFPDQVKLLGQLVGKLSKDSGIPITWNVLNGITTHAELSRTYKEVNHYDPESYVAMQGWTLQQFYDEVIKAAKGENDDMDLTKLTGQCAVDALGVAWISNPGGAILYDEKKKPTDRVLPLGSPWAFHNTDDGMLSVGGLIDQKDALIKFNRGKTGGDYRGMTVKVITDDCYTQQQPKTGMPGVQKLPQGELYLVINQSEDKKYFDLGVNQWVDTSKLNIVL
ncbi:N-acetylmuramoyl-L-alanine amidase [Holzapfeliella sp. He02]|uniref:N-acetylmuramoyl-L-alanine amidase n=1 Tax=Holzapfeliella saturejae TaxID=3082953 RepID=A0ABU8SK35_9LACO